MSGAVIRGIEKLASGNISAQVGGTAVTYVIQEFNPVKMNVSV